MATSEVQICNLALSRIGVKVQIQDLTEQSAEAGQCALQYPQSRDELLEMFEWPFAKRRKVLSPALAATRTDWAYVYALPSDCLAPRHILTSGMREPLNGQRIPYAIELADGGGSRVLLCDLVDPEIVYTGAITAVGLFSPLFVKALSWKLAMDLAMPLAVKADYAAAAEKAFLLARAEAVAAVLNQETQDPYPDSEIISARS